MPYHATTAVRYHLDIGVVLPVGSHISAPRPIAEVRAFAQHAEAVGLDAVWVFDHLLFRFPGQPESGAHEAWTTMALLGAATERIGIGSLVLGARLRNPGLLAKMAATLDEGIGGRLTLGIGGGWHDPELEAFGLPIDHRLGRTEEAMHILRGLLDGERVTVEGDWERADDAVLLPPPGRRIPILSASKKGRMARIAARYADAWNGAWVAHPHHPDLVERVEELYRACDEVGRDPRRSP